MSNNLKESQLIAAELLSVGISSKIVSETLGLRAETLSRWRQQENFKQYVNYRTEEKCSLIEKQFFRIYYLSLNVLEEMLCNKELNANLRGNLAMKYIANFGIDQSIKQKMTSKKKDNYDTLKEVFDLIDNIYGKCRSEAKEEQVRPKKEEYNTSGN